MPVDQDYLVVAILDYILRIREDRRVEDVDLQTLWAQCSDILQETFSMVDVEQTLRAMEEDFLISYTPSAQTQNMVVVVTGKGAIIYEDRKSLLSEKRKTRFLRKQRRAADGRPHG